VKSAGQVLLILAAVALGIYGIQYLGVIKVWTVLMVLNFVFWGFLTLVGSYFLLTHAFPGIERTVKRWLGRPE
jgi:hypothetical protein